jgi:hypothetical protein
MLSAHSPRSTQAYKDNDIVTQMKNLKNNGENVSFEFI